MRRLATLFFLLASPALAADFTSLGLSQWTVLREAADEIRISEETLALRTQPGRIWGGNGAANLILSPAVAGKEPRQLRALVTLQDPIVKYEQAGLLCYVDDDHFVKLIVEHIDGEPWVVSAIESPDQTRVLSKQPIQQLTAELALELHGDVVYCRFRDAAEPRSEWQFASSSIIAAANQRRLGLFTQDGPPDRVNWALFEQIGVSSAHWIDPQFGIQKVAGGCEFTEGPALSSRGDLYFSDGPNDRILRLDRSGNLSVFLSPCGAANGLLFDSEDRLLFCQSSRPGGGRAVAQMDLTDDKPEIITRKFEGQRYIAPNDLCIDRQGRIYFTDPYYSGEKSQPVAGVYRIDPDRKVQRVVEDLLKPNGILITPDSKTLFVSDRGTQKLHRYKVSGEGQLTPDGILYDFAPDRGIDGMWMDELGNIYGAAGQDETTGLFVISPAGNLLLHQPMPEFATNVILGGDDGQDLFLTAGKSVYKMRTRFKTMQR